MSKCHFAAALALLMPSAVASAQPAAAQSAPIIHNTFDTEEEGWVGFGANSRASVSKQVSFNGAGSLRFDYDVKKAVISALMLPTPDGKLAKVKTLRFWVQTDAATTVAVALQESGGARYYAPFSAPQGKWQKVELSITDFTLMEGPGNAPDPNNHLDMDQVAAIAITDMAQFIAQAGNPDFEKLVGIKTGAHSFYLDDFSATEESLPATVVTSPTEIKLDTFARPQINWVALGGPAVSRAEGKMPGARSLQAEFHQAPGKITGLVRPFRKGTLQGMTKLDLLLASKAGATLVVQLEEVGGGKFNSIVEVPAGGAPKGVTLEFAELSPADDSAVKDRKLDARLVTQVTILDPSGILGGMEQDNTIWISAVRAVAK